jgi:hypothetical protein
MYMRWNGADRLSTESHGLYANADIRAAIYYDHDTSFYFDGNGTTRWQGTDTYSKMRIGLTARNNNRRNEFTGDSNYWVGTMGWGTTDFISAFDWGSGFIDTWGGIPNSPGDTSHYVGVQASHYNAGYNTGYGIQIVGGPIQGLWHTSYWSTKRSWYKIAMYGLNESSGTFWSTIMYDSNNGGYYIDPNSTSQLHYVLADNWFRPQGGSGLYTQDYGSHWRTSLQSSYGTWESYGYARNGWAGINIIDPSGYWNHYMHESGNGGLYQQNGNGWIFYYSRGNDCLGIGDSSTVGGYAARINNSLYVNSTLYVGGDAYSPIFYDANDTFYRVDPNGTTRLAYVESRSLFAGFGIGGEMQIHPNQGSFGGYFRCARHLVIETFQPGHHTYVIDTGTGVGVVRFYGSQGWNAHSDGTLKNIHSTFTDTLSKLNDITPVYYTFNNLENDKMRLGLIAQEVEVHYPELIQTDPMNDKLTLDYTGMIPVLLAAIKELKAELDVVKEELNTLKNQ